jgi:acetate kinase
LPSDEERLLMRSKAREDSAMTDVILTLNAGSSSLKIAVFADAGDRPLAIGQVDRIGARGDLTLSDATGSALVRQTADHAAHDVALDAILSALGQTLPGLQVTSVGHRVVHGGPDFAAPVRIDDVTLARIAALAPLAPLHQPHNLAGIRAAMRAFPDAPQIACFDTAFHRHHPWVHDTYALPPAFHDSGVRRYGFHGLSYDYLSGEMHRRWPALATGRVVMAHLGNGASICAIKGGRSVATTMGFSTLDGLAMGTRPGQIDPGVILYLLQEKGMTAAEVSDLLYRQSGLLGLSGLSNDMRTLAASDDPRAAAAIAYFVTRVQAATAEMAAALQGIDALVFSGGIGENAAPIRAEVCAGLAWMGIRIDEDANAAHAPDITAKGAPVRVLIIPTNEELVIARATRAT